jgi:hypothetical protein
MINELSCRAYEIAHSAVDLAGFVSGNGYSVVFETVTYPSGWKSKILHTHTHLLPLVTAAKLGDNSFQELLPLVMPNLLLQRALRDLCETMVIPLITHINCARAIEALRNLIAPDEDKDKAWKKFRELLQLDRSYLQMITDHSRGGRHGDVSTYLPPETTGEIGVRAWVITNRCLEFLKRGGEDPLPLAEFPLLNG